MFDDFSLFNIMIDNTVTGYIDSEVAAIVPSCKCAMVHEWLQVIGHNDGRSEQGGSKSGRKTVRSVFMREVSYHQVGADG